MSTHQANGRIQLVPMAQLTEAIGTDDDWTGITDAAARKKRQSRLNMRAYRRRKALDLQAKSASQEYANTAEPSVPCWVEEQQTVSLLPQSVARSLNSAGTRLMGGESSTHRGIMFPLCPDHLIILLQFNVLRASIANRRLLLPLESGTTSTSQCDSSTALHVLTNPAHLLHAVPASLQPTALQQTVPHEDWLDIIPHPVWRDNVILAIGTFDEDDLWSDIIGGLFEGFPDSEVEHRGLIAWSPPWHVDGWELSKGFLRKWGWSLKGCGDVVDATNRWRKMRGAEPLVLEVGTAV